MDLIREWCRRLWYLVNRRRIDAALQREMDAHRAAMARPERFGNTRRLREDAHEVWGWSWLDRAGADLRLAARTLGRTPGYTLGVAGSLALGVAFAASAVAVTNAYLIRSLPYPAADRLFHVMYAPPGPWEPRGMTALDWSALQDVVEFAITSSGETFYLDEGSGAQTARGLRVTNGFIGGLGVRAVAGRSLVASDFRAEPVGAALIASRLWRDRFGSDPAAIGSEIDTESENGQRERFRIVGVLPPGFYVGRDSRDQVDLVVPLTTLVRTYLIRLRDGVPPDAAERRITAAARAVAVDLPANWSGVRLESAHERYVGASRPVLIGVTAVAALVLIIVSANVAVLTVLRAARRRKEIALRLALGASRRQIARMFAAETGWICAAACGAGLVATRVCLGLLGPRIEAQLGRPAPGGTATIALDATVLTIVAITGAVMALSLSFLPLLAPGIDRLAEVLRRTGGAATDGRSMRRLRSGMLAFEVAGTLVLLVGAVLMVRSAAAMARTDLGFEPVGLARARIVLRGADYADARAFSQFYGALTDRLSAAIAAPVVFSNWPPFAAFPERAIEIEGGAGPVAEAGSVQVGAGYFATLGIAMRSGRDFARDDESGPSPVAVVSETLAARLWPGDPALGRRLRQIEVTQGGPRPAGPWQTVVGVAGDVRQSYDDADRSDVYTPGTPSGRFGSFHIRTAAALPSVHAGVRAAVAAIDPRAVVDAPRAVDDENRERAGTRFLATMLAGMAAMALTIAVVGIYAVTAYAVQQREREMAIRIALGAARRSVVRLFMTDGGAALATGLAAGLVGAVAAAGVLEHRAFGVAEFDPGTIVATAVLVGAAGLAATWWPARRVSRCDTIAALKDG